MQILKEGKFPNEAVPPDRMFGTCSRCGCRLICRGDETRPGHHNASFRFIVCPTKDCATDILLTPFPPFASDGRCRCSVADLCPLGKTGSETRCHKSELEP